MPCPWLPRASASWASQWRRGPPLSHVCANYSRIEPYESLKRRRRDHPRGTVVGCPWPCRQVHRGDALACREREMAASSPGRNSGRAELVRAQPPAEQLYQRQLAVIADRRRELADLERD